jgi:hypothetical protein
MIQYIKRKDLDVDKYNSCIENAVQSRIYAFSWYLDIVVDHWDVLVLDDYKAIMPIPWRKKAGIKYAYPPFWLLELGVFSLDENVDYQAFFDVLFHKFKFIESRLNTDNIIKNSSSYLIAKQMQVLKIEDTYESIFENYRKDRKKDLRKANKAGLTKKWEDNPDKLIQLFKDNVGKRTPFIIEKDYVNLKKVMMICIDKTVGAMLSIYNKEDKLVASGFFLKHKDCITILVSSTDFNNRNNGENTFLIDSAIQKYQNDYKLFNFGGSSMETIANYFLSFGAKTQEYQQIKYTNLPFFVKLFKR